MNNLIIFPFLDLFLNISMGHAPFWTLICICNFRLLRGSLGFGEEALQSLPGNIGSQVHCNCVFLVFKDHSCKMTWLVMHHVPSMQTYKQDVNDVLTALDLVIKRGLIDPSRVAVVGGSHGGFLTTHLIGQVLWLPLFLCILWLCRYYCA